MPYPIEGAGERPDPLRDHHVAFPDAPAPQPAGPSLPSSAWAPAARTSRVGAPPSGTPPTAEPAPPPPGRSTGRRGPSSPRRRRVLGTIVVVWICFGVFGNHDNHLSYSSGGTGIEMGGAGYGADASGLLPEDTAVSAMPPGVQRFLVKVASESTQVRVTRSTQSGPVEEPTPGSWTGEVVPTAGYAAPFGPAGQQSSQGPVSPKVSGIVTATTDDSASTVQCRVYANDVLVLMSTGPGTVTCRVPAIKSANG
ncbi:MAG: hypothetical protein ABIQ53_05225 [Terracoccus sp.]